MLRLQGAQEGLQGGEGSADEELEGPAGVLRLSVLRSGLCERERGGEGVCFCVRGKEKLHLPSVHA